MMMSRVPHKSEDYGVTWFCIVCGEHRPDPCDCICCRFAGLLDKKNFLESDEEIYGEQVFIAGKKFTTFECAPGCDYPVTWYHGKACQKKRKEYDAEKDKANSD